MKTIELTQGYVALVDDEDFDALSQHRWHAVRGKDTVYARWGKVYLHRVIMNAQKGQEVDHINGDGLDNRKANLRICSHSENLRNQKVSRANKYGYRGVGWHKQKDRFRAYIKQSGNMIHLGLFETAEEAALAYDMAAKQYHGEFARLNFGARC
jgi:hypothetical protein